MLNFYFAYLLVVVIAICQWAHMRFILHRGLQISFVKYRQQSSMSNFFMIFAKPYLILMAWVVLHACFLTYCCFMLAKGLEILNFQNGAFIIAVMIFFLKDRIYYITANYVLSKSEKSA